MATQGDQQVPGASSWGSWERGGRSNHISSEASKSSTMLTPYEMKAKGSESDVLLIFININAEIMRQPGQASQALAVGKLKHTSSRGASPHSSTNCIQLGDELIDPLCNFNHAQYSAMPAVVQV